MAVNSMGEVARALRRISADIPIDQQINTVSNALVGTQKIREPTVQKGKGLSVDATNLFENLKSRVGQISTIQLGAEPDLDDLAEWLNDLEIIEKFVERVIEHYSAADQDLSQQVIRELEKVRAEISAASSLKIIKDKIIALKSLYRANPEMPKEDYQDQLNAIAHEVRQWDEEFLPNNPLFKESIVIRKQLAELKRLLDEAYALLELEGHPGIVGDVALNLLRVASGMIQQAKNQFELKQALGMAAEASENLGKSGKELIEQGRPFRLLIQQSVMLFVDKQLKKMENELNLPLYFVPGDMKGGRETSERMLINKERLLTYYDFAVSWSGPQQAVLLERMALIFEQITDRASKAKVFTLEDLSKRKVDDKQFYDQMHVAAALYAAEMRGKASIDPDAIFGTAEDPVRNCQRLIEQLPDPSLEGSSALFMEMLGRLFVQATSLEEKITEYPEIQGQVKLAFSRLNAHLSHVPQDLDIEVEEKVIAEYFPMVWELIKGRFFQNLGVSTELIKDVSQADHLEVMSNYRILSDFLQGHYGEIQTFPMLLDVKQRFRNEVDGHAAKLLLTCVNQLGLSLPVSDQQVESQLESRDGELRRFFECWKGRKKDFDISLLIEECRDYRNKTRQFLDSLAKDNPEETHELLKKLYPKILEDLPHWRCFVPQSMITAKNRPDQFVSDHQIPETFPLFVKGVEETRQEGESVVERLDSLTGGELTLNNQVMQLATRPLLESPLAHEEILEAFCGFKGLSKLELALEECVQFLSVDREKKRGELTALGKVLVADPSANEESQEMARLTMTVSMQLSSKNSDPICVTFSAKPFHEMIAEFRKDEIWTLL